MIKFGKNKDIVLKSIEVGNYIKEWLLNNYYEKISMGEYCNSAWYLKEIKNKKPSHPYDWIFSSPQIVSHTILDEFKSFLNRDLLLKIYKKKVGHKLYHSSLFNHKSPLNSTEEFNYYNRAVNRFLALLNNKINHFFSV